MDSFSYSLKKLIFAKREPVPEFKDGRVDERIGRNKEKRANSRSKDRRDSSPFEEVKMDQCGVNAEETERATKPQQNIPVSPTQEQVDYIRPVFFSGYTKSQRCEDVRQDVLQAGSDEKNKHVVVKDVGKFQTKFTSFANISLEGSDSEVSLISLNSQYLEAGDEEKEDSGRSTPVLSDTLKEELEESSGRPKAERHKPLTREQFVNSFDADGRIVDEHEIMRTIFKGIFIIYYYYYYK